MKYLIQQHLRDGSFIDSNQSSMSITSVEEKEVILLLNVKTKKSTDCDDIDISVIKDQLVSEGVICD